LEAREKDGKWIVEMAEEYYSPTGAKHPHTHTSRENNVSDLTIHVINDIQQFTLNNLSNITLVEMSVDCMTYM